MLTVEKLIAAKKFLEDADESERKRLEQREADGLPSWDVIVSGEQWPYYRDEGIKAGCIIEGKDHYIVVTPPYPPARIMLSWGAGQEMTAPNPTESKGEEGGK